MYKKIVVPVMLSIFILQISNLLFANEKTEAKTEVEAGDEVVAIVNGEEIFRKELDRRLGVFKRLKQEVTRADKIGVINQLATKVLLKQFIEGQNIEVSGGEIQGELEKIEHMLRSNPNYSNKSLVEILKPMGSSIGELKDEIRRTLALGKYLDNRVDEEDKISYFESNIGVFNGEKVKLSYIFIETTKLKTAAELENAKQKIEEAKKEIDNGADFAETARKYSTYFTAEKGCDMGFIPRRGSLLPKSEVEELEEAAFLMEVGEISEPVKTQFGYHIIKVTDKEEGKDVKYEEVKDMVDFVYMQIKTDAILKGLSEKAEIEIAL